ncbi:MAG TPA: hypothetical protein VGF99_16750, partial [Myxococcota bacterium]
MSVVVAVVLGLAAQTAIGDAPPEPAPDAVAPAPVAPRDDVDDDNDGGDDVDGDDDVAPKTDAPKADVAPPKPDAKAAADDEWSMVTTLGTTGCVVGGLIPGVTGLAGLGLFYGGAAASSCAP